MPGPLKNERHELFAQKTAKGVLQFEAYRAVGYTGDEAHASRLAARDDVRARVGELQARTATRAIVTAAGITQRLLGIADKGEKTSDAPMLQVARAALMDAAKLNGLITDKKEITNPDGSLRPTVIRIVAADDRSGTEAPS